MQTFSHAPRQIWIRDHIVRSVKSVCSLNRYVILSLRYNWLNLNSRHLHCSAVVDFQWQRREVHLHEVCYETAGNYVTRYINAVELQCLLLTPSRVNKRRSIPCVTNEVPQTLSQFLGNVELTFFTCFNRNFDATVHLQSLITVSTSESKSLISLWVVLLYIRPLESGI